MINNKKRIKKWVFFKAFSIMAAEANNNANNMIRTIIFRMILIQTSNKISNIIWILIIRIYQIFLTIYFKIFQDLVLATITQIILIIIIKITIILFIINKMKIFHSLIHNLHNNQMIHSFKLIKITHNNNIKKPSLHSEIHEAEVLIQIWKMNRKNPKKKVKKKMNLMKIKVNIGKFKEMKPSLKNYTIRPSRYIKKLLYLNRKKNIFF